MGIVIDRCKLSFHFCFFKLASSPKCKEIILARDVEDLLDN